MLYKDVKVGQRVCLYRELRSFFKGCDEQRWYGLWQKEFAFFIGRCYTISDVRDIGVEFSELPGYRFPWQALKLLED